MNLNSREGLIARLRRSKEARRQFTESHVNKAIAHQLRVIRDALGWSQEQLAKDAGMNQNAISRLESADYGRPTITTLKRLAAALDVSLIVRFAPFSEVVDWVSGTPHVNEGLTSDSLAVPIFTKEEEHGVFAARALPVPPRFQEMVRGDDKPNTHRHKDTPKENVVYAGLGQQSPQRAAPLPF
jgi:transcriptional regulator with XRE-family HTH domain